MKSVIYIFCFSLAINIQAAHLDIKASHPYKNKGFYKKIIKPSINPLCALEEELNPFLNDDFTQNYFKAKEYTLRKQIELEEVINIKELLNSFAIESLRITSKTPKESNGSFTNSSIGYQSQSADISNYSLNERCEFVDSLLEEAST